MTDKEIALKRGLQIRHNLDWLTIYNSVKNQFETELTKRSFPSSICAVQKSLQCLVLSNQALRTQDNAQTDLGQTNERDPVWNLKSLFIYRDGHYRSPSPACPACVA